MRVTQSETYRNFISDLETLNSMFNRLSRQVSTGKKLTSLADSPGGSAELISLTDQQAGIDQYRSCTGMISYYLGIADSALNEVNNLVTSIYSKGSQAASETVNHNARETLASDIRSLRDQILSLANSQARGRYVFAGSRVDSPPFVISGDSVSYVGDSDINTVSVDSNTEVKQGVSGLEVFQPVFDAIESLLTAIEADDTQAMGAALKQFSVGISAVGQARGKIGAGMSALQNVLGRLDSRETNLKERRGNIEDADLAEAAVRLTQVKAALQTAVSAGGSILTRSNLFDILG